MPKNSKTEDWMSFLELSLAHTKNLNKIEQLSINFGWMSFPYIGVANAPEIRQYELITVPKPC